MAVLERHNFAGKEDGVNLLSHAKGLRAPSGESRFSRSNKSRSFRGLRRLLEGGMSEWLKHSAAE